MRNHLFQDDSGVIHSCHLSTIGRDTSLVWTDCGIDVPENASFQGYEVPDCKECAQKEMLYLLIAALETCLSVVEEKSGHYRPAWLDTCYETLAKAKATL